MELLKPELRASWRAPHHLCAQLPGLTLVRSTELLSAHADKGPSPAAECRSWHSCASPIRACRPCGGWDAFVSVPPALAALTIVFAYSPCAVDGVVTIHTWEAVTRRFNGLGRIGPKSLTWLVLLAGLGRGVPTEEPLCARCGGAHKHACVVCQPPLALRRTPCNRQASLPCTRVSPSRRWRLHFSISHRSRERCTSCACPARAIYIRQMLMAVRCCARSPDVRF